MDSMDLIIQSLIDDGPIAKAMEAKIKSWKVERSFYRNLETEYSSYPSLLAFINKVLNFGKERFYNGDYACVVPCGTKFGFTSPKVVSTFRKLKEIYVIVDIDHVDYEAVCDVWFISERRHRCKRFHFAL